MVFSDETGHKSRRGIRVKPTMKEEKRGLQEARVLAFESQSPKTVGKSWKKDQRGPYDVKDGKDPRKRKRKKVWKARG